MDLAWSNSIVPKSGKNMRGFLPNWSESAPAMRPKKTGGAFPIQSRVISNELTLFCTWIWWSSMDWSCWHAKKCRCKIIYPRLPITTYQIPAYGVIELELVLADLKEEEKINASA